MNAQKIIAKTVTILTQTALVITELIVSVVFSFLLFILVTSKISPPEIIETEVGTRIKVAFNHYAIGDNWLKKNEFGIWEMYIEGAPYERGLIYGELAKELIQKQETIFVGQIDHFVPNKTWQGVLQLMIGFFNKNLPDNIQLENQQEIYGISKAFSDEYDYIATKYSRILNYHGAHDIGHALNDYSMVGCTSFALRGNKTADGKLLIGRNFDFYVGDDFAEEKLILFVNPDEGIPFVSYSWAGFTGVASGLNSKGLSVTINASKSDLPRSSKTPIALLAREILQYAETIEEAIEIAEKRDIFVSETLLISSKKDGKAVLIEKSPQKMGVYDNQANELYCTNHYQSNTFIKDEINITNVIKSDSRHRYSKIKSLISSKNSLTIEDAAYVLRSQTDINGDTLGMGNPRAVNQLIAHHSVIMQPEKLMFYASTSNFQLGPYLAYNLADVFDSKKSMSKVAIEEDPFVNSLAYSKFLEFKKINTKISNYLIFGNDLSLSKNAVKYFISLNSESYISYEMIGRYYQKKMQHTLAIKHLKIALTKKTASLEVENELKKLIIKCHVK